VTAFVAAHRDRFGVVPICRVLQVAPSAVRSALARPPGPRQLADEALKPLIAELHAANYGVYGARKIKAALAREHHLVVDRARVTRLMCEQGLRGATRTRSTVTTRPDHTSPRAPDLVQRRFHADRPNELWVSDFERHEAPVDRVVMKGHHHRLVAAGRLKLRAA